jgi:muconate cycloisomerase
VRQLAIESVDTVIADVPLRRPHRFAGTSMHQQSFVIVKVNTRPGVQGVGEAVVAGGPWWGGETVEGIKVLIDRYLAPYLVGGDASRVGAVAARMEHLVHGNPFAKAGVEMALWDALGKWLDLPLYALLGGLRRGSLPVTWALGADPAPAVIDEAQRKLAAGEHASFKLKMGAGDPAADVRRVQTVARTLSPHASIRVDLNGAWDAATALRWLPRLEDAGVDLVEQPVPRWNRRAMRRLSQRLTVPVMADESLCTPQDALALYQDGAADVFALKLGKSGGLLAVHRIAALAETAGIPCYGGTTLESSVGTAAAAHAFCASAAVTAGSELFGPLLLADDLTEEPLTYRDGELHVPDGPGLGVALDERKLAKYRR